MPRNVFPQWRSRRRLTDDAGAAAGDGRIRIVGCLPPTRARTRHALSWSVAAIGVHFGMLSVLDRSKVGRSFVDAAGVLVDAASYAVATTIVGGWLLWRYCREDSAEALASEVRVARQAETERLSIENARLANLDSLTGLPNRRYFLAQLDSLTAERGTTEEGFAVGLLDLDRFKPVNDIHGHLVGDRLLAELGQRLAAAAAGEDGVLVARLGGDEFGFVIADDRDDVGAIGDRICALVSEPYELDDVRITVGCSCGIALFPEAGRTAREIFDRADYALYHSKSRRIGGCAVFSDQHERHIRSMQVLHSALQTADFEAEMDLHFQPIIDVHSMAVIGVEALARWQSPVLGSVAPTEFIPAAESLGLIGAITIVLFHKALAAIRLLPNAIGLSFNISAIDIASPTTTAALIAAIEASAIDPRRVTIEITETAVMRDFDEAAATIARIRALGSRIALDDFGTGFSSLTHLRRLALDRVKVDGSFAQGLGDVSGRKMVAAIAELCRTLEIECVIEGIETPDQLLRIRQFGYRLAQGYLFARPMSMIMLSDWLGQWQHEWEWEWQADGAMVRGA